MKSSKEIGLPDFLSPVTPFDKFIQKRKAGNNHGRGRKKNDLCMYVKIVYV